MVLVQRGGRGGRPAWGCLVWLAKVGMLVGREASWWGGLGGEVDCGGKLPCG